MRSPAGLADQPSILRYQEALAFLMFHMGEFAAARQLQEQNVAAFKAAQQTFRAAVGSGFLSYLEAKDGRYGIARAMQHEAFGVFRAADDKHWMVRELMVAAASAVIVGDLTLAAQLLWRLRRAARAAGRNGHSHQDPQPAGSDGPGPGRIG